MLLDELLHNIAESVILHSSFIVSLSLLKSQLNKSLAYNKHNVRETTFIIYIKVYVLYILLHQNSSFLGILVYYRR